MTDNVIQLGSRKTLAEVQQQEAIAAEKALAQLSEKQAEIKKLTLASIDAVRKMVEDDQMGGLVIITQTLADRLFLSDIVIQREVTPPSSRVMMMTSRAAATISSGRTSGEPVRAGS